MSRTEDLSATSQSELKVTMTRLLNRLQLPPTDSILREEADQLLGATYNNSKGTRPCAPVNASIVHSMETRRRIGLANVAADCR